MNNAPASAEVAAGSGACSLLEATMTCGELLGILVKFN
jgi:hypothetical protein